MNESNDDTVEYFEDSDKIHQFILQILHKIVIFFIPLGDFFVHFHEKFYTKIKGHHSEKAWNEWLDYYKEIHIRKPHDVKLFFRTLKRRGSPDFPNPYPEGVEEHYDYHPQGLIMADIECILTPISPPKFASSDYVDEIGNSLDEKQAQTKGMERFKKEIEKRQLSLDCMSMVLILDGHMPRLVNIAHKKDIEFVMIECLLSGQYEKYGLHFKDGLKNALKYKYINKKIAKKTLDEKLLLQQEKKKKALIHHLKTTSSEKMDNNIQNNCPETQKNLN